MHPAATQGLKRSPVSSSHTSHQTHWWSDGLLNCHYSSSNITLSYQIDQQKISNILPILAAFQKNPRNLPGGDTESAHSLILNFDLSYKDTYAWTQISHNGRIENNTVKSSRSKESTLTEDYCRVRRRMEDIKRVFPSRNWSLNTNHLVCVYVWESVKM